MSKYNLGIVKTSILTNLNEEASIKGFIGLLKESDLLKTVLSIVDNIEKKHIPNEDLAIKYIDENVDLLKSKGYTKEAFEKENFKLFPLIEGVQFAYTPNKALFENIHVLLYESLQGKKSTNVNRLHDSFVFVLEHLKNNNKKVVVESVDLPVIPQEIIAGDFLLKRAIFEFNEKYTKILSEDEVSVLKSIVNENKESKESSFAAVKESTLNALKELKLDVDTQNKNKMDVYEQREIDKFTSNITESIKNINLLKYNEDTFVNDVIDLINLKTELCS